MGLSFRKVHVEVTGIGPSNGAVGSGLARWGIGVKIHHAEVALRGFRIGYFEGDHHFRFQRIELADVVINNGDVEFEVFMKLEDDTTDTNKFKGEVEVLVIADVDFP
jgi:hypothetical protein